MCRRLAALVIALLIAMPVSAQGTLPNPPEGALGFAGRVDCGKWTEARTAKRANSVESFLQGLLNGMVMGSGIEFWQAGGIDVTPVQVFLWMDKYCRDKPLSDVFVGAVVLVNERTGNAWSRHHDKLVGRR